MRKYALCCFNTQERFASQLQIARLDWSATTGPLYYLFRLWQRFRPYHATSTFRENGSFDPLFLKAPANVYLHGYFQSERYFAANTALLRKEFSFRNEPTETNRKIARQIKATQAVSIHIRRGDYVSDTHTHQVHGVCSLEYYEESVKRVTSKVMAPHFYVFSDDPVWVRENLHIEQPVTFISNNSPDQAHEDLHLMSLCQHHIIANSSFSWWGAWLNPNPDKIVMAPQRWYNDPNKDTRYLLPETWVKV
ncbi:MAG: alpha-1,2-fucosyltransferase [Chloroflexota bacterium]